MRRSLPWILAWTWACAADPQPAVDAGPLDSGALDLGAPDSGPEDLGVEPDSGPPDSGTPPDVGLPPNRCDDLGLPKRPFNEAQGGLRFGELAGDFTVTTTTGATWNLKTEWTGCESYVFLVYFPGAGGNTLFRSSLDNLVQSPLHAHYFFTSNEADAAARQTRLGALGERLKSAIERRTSGPAQEAAQWQRFHLVAERANEIPGSVGEMLRDYLAFAPTSVIDIGDGRQAPAPAPTVFGIDRLQRWDAGDNLNEYVGGPVSFRMASFLPRFYDFQANLAARLNDETETVVVPLLHEVRTTARLFTRTATLPDAVTLASYDRLELDVRIECDARNPFACSEWDRIARVSVCQNTDCSERLELARWITPYWRRGVQHWAIDASPLLPLLDPGGPRRLFVETGPEWERATEYRVDLDLRLSRSGSGRRAKGALLAFRGGVFDATYPSSAAFRFTPPANASHVNLVTILSGHGQVSPSNCAEWCDHRHQFTLNGTRLEEIRPSSTVGSGLGCGERAADGVPPGQWGNWAPERAYWCPGLPVALRTLDFGTTLRLGEENTLEYSANFAGVPPPGGDIDLSTYVVWYE